MNGLVMDQAGNLFGTIYAGVFELSPSPGGWTQQWLYWTFPSTGLTMDPAGNLFFANLSQEVYELSPNGNGGWNPTALHTFTGYPKDGQNPQGTPVCDDGGNVYGTTTSGGRENGGTIYKLTPGKKGKWKERILHSFTYPGDGKDGSYPQAGIVLDAAGEMYGTTLWGKDSYPGTVYKLGKGGYKNLWTFNGTDGSGALGSLILDSAGNLYGTTSAGGANGSGVVFEVTP
jgi:uncharacterized repeat protein (TIGR03803 family)